MQPPINLAKIIPPRFPRILHRSRLLERLEQQRDKKLILILGQAAQGKSTLAFTYVSNSQVPAAWLNLETEDSEAVTLFYSLVHSLTRALPEADVTQLLAYPSLPTGPREEIPLYRDWLLALLNRIKTPVLVVLDGLDRLAPQAPAFRFLQVLLEIAPPHLQLFMLSREMPPLKVQELKMRQEVHILHNTDLAFTARETRIFLHDVRRLALPHDLMAQLHKITEGWIGGLVLLCEILEQMPAEAREKFLSGEVSEKFTGEVFDYFDESIFSGRSEEERDFLLKSSILGVVEPAFIKDFIGTDKAGDILERLSLKNLFVQPIFDKQRGWLYRYHQLFQDFLRARFKEALPAAEQAGAYLRAGSLLEARGDLENAVDHYLQAGAISQAVSTIEKVGLQFLKRGKTAELANWLQSLPADVVQTRPWLLLYHYLTGRASGAPDYFASLQRAHVIFQEQQDFRGLLLTSAYLLEMSLYVCPTCLPQVTQISQAEELLHRGDPRAFPFESAVLWHQLGLAQQATDIRRGYQYCRNAYLLAKDEGERQLEIQALIYACMILISLGEFSAARETCQLSEAALTAWASPELEVMYLVSAGMLSGFLGEVEHYETLAKKAQALAEEHGLTFLYPVTLLHRVMSLGYAGRYAEALETGLSLLNHPASPATYLKGIASVHLAIFSYHTGDLPAARQFSQKARQTFSSETGRSDYHLLFLKVTESVISYDKGELTPAAEEELLETLRQVTGVSSYLLMAEAHWVLALWRWRQGKVEAAAEHVKAGMQLAEARGSYYSIVLSPRDRGRIFTLALELGVEEVWDRLPPLLASLADLVRPDLERLTRHQNPEIAAQAGEICRTIHRQGLPRLQILTLGKFAVLHGGDKPEELAWERNQPRLLLKALVARGAANVPKEALIEDLWPASPPEITEQNFRVNLHRLRKELEPDLDKNFGSSYIHLQNGRLSLDPELCRVDVNDFLTSYRSGRKQEEQDNHAQALIHYKEALAVYGGDFLREELYLPWAEESRQELQATYLDLLDRVSKIYERQGSLGRAIEYCKKVIQTDPALEPAYRRLMTLYAGRGLRSEALRTYEACRQALRKELDTEPDEVTTAIFKKIQEPG